MAESVYIASALMSVVCMVMLFWQYRKQGSHLLLWSSCCFFGLMLNNSVLFVDMILLPELDFGGSLWRNGLSAASGSLLLFGLIWEMT